MASKQSITVLRELTAEDKVAPQARTILNTIVEAAGVNQAIDRDDLVAKLTEAGSLNTRQDPGRVVAYYLPRLKEAGLADFVTEKAAAVEGEEKPKRTRKTKADANSGPTEVAPAAEDDVEGQVAV